MPILQGDLINATFVGATDLVRCEYTGRCLRRNENRMVSASVTERCYRCGYWFCTAHSHTNPSARPAQYCRDHGEYHPTCMRVLECTDCGENTCFSTHECEPEQNSYTGSYRRVELTFDGEAGSHPQAMGSRYVGMEIEVENGGNFILPRTFGIEGDGSLINGVEIQTPPMRGAALVGGVNEAMDTLLNAGYEATERCGLHIHVDLRDKQHDPRFLSRLFATGFAVEDVLYNLQTHDRHESQFSIPLRKNYPFNCARGDKATDFEYTYNHLSKKERFAKSQVKRLRREKWGNRYLGFNFHSVFFRGTLECRIHEGTLDANRILGWAELVQGIIAHAEKRLSFNKLIELMDETHRPAKISAMEKLLNLNDSTMGYIYKNYRTSNVVELPFSMNDKPNERYW